MPVKEYRAAVNRHLREQMKGRQVTLRLDGEDLADAVGDVLPPGGEMRRVTHDLDEFIEEGEGVFFADDAPRPSYGIFEDPNAPFQQIPEGVNEMLQGQITWGRYGRKRIVLRDVEPRTSAYFGEMGDIHASGHGRPVASNADDLADSWAWKDPDSPLASDPLDWDGSDSALALDTAPFIEAQVHGPIRLPDIEKVVLDDLDEAITLFNGADPPPGWARTTMDDLREAVRDGRLTVEVEGQGFVEWDDLSDRFLLSFEDIPRVSQTGRPPQGLPDLSIETTKVANPYGRSLEDLSVKVEPAFAGSQVYGDALSEIGDVMPGGLTNKTAPGSRGFRAHPDAKFIAKGKAKQAYDEALEGISQVHSVPDDLLESRGGAWAPDGGPSNRFMVQTTSAKDGANGFYSSSIDNRPLQIVLNTQGDHMAATMAHEFGHLLDHQDFGSKQTYATRLGRSDDIDKAFTELQQAINESAEIKTLKRMRTNPEEFAQEIVPVHPTTGEAIVGELVTSYPTQRHVAYLLDEREQFARAYAQWIAREVDPSHPLAQQMVAEIETMTGGVGRYNYGDQWSEESFEPIARAFRKVFQAAGMIQ